MDKDSLRKLIEIEIENLERLVDENIIITDRFTDKPDFIEIRAAGSILHDFYCAVEKIFKRITIYINNDFPDGEDWHTELLLQMTRPIEKTHKAVISRELLEKLKEYLRFRHLFRNIYGFELN
ncbi:MAG: ribonuclease toxin HepT-like protein [Candidatus Humimicrobiaceae bacterium]